MKLSSRLIIAAILAVMNGCDTSFEPQGPFESRIVVYCWLTPNAEKTIARVYSTYDASNLSSFSRPEDTPILDATVTLIHADTALLMRDTLLIRPDKRRYSSDLYAFVLSPMQISFGASYILQVSSPTRGTVSAKVIVPDHGVLTLRNAHMLDAPGRHPRESVVLNSRLSAQAYGYLVRALIEFDHFVGGSTSTAVHEVPIMYGLYAGGKWEAPQFPVLRKRASSLSSSSVEVDAFPVTNFSIEAARIRDEYQGVAIKRVLFVLTQVEQGLYTYFNVVNGFQDVNSIRLDEPDYSNIEGGVGVLGAFSIDTTAHIVAGGL